jgi:hypothetical protein
MTNSPVRSQCVAKETSQEFKTGVHKSHFLVTVVTKFNTMPPNISGSSEWNLLRVTLLAFIFVENVCTSALNQKDGLSNNILLNTAVIYRTASSFLVILSSNARK